MIIEKRLSITDLAKAWQCSRQHIYNLIRDGELEPVRIGKLTRFRPQDIAEYEARQKQGTEHCQDLEQSDLPSPSPGEASGSMSSGGNEAPSGASLAAQRAKKRLGRS